ncbi:MAG: hypothetical protein LC794_12040 [Acidobacteria bacterium]|nr:hypothetical protein [Acidobacteriota bacterium]MCA1627398.1 hypothetical protein [Acidobacteriota bacterium]
MAKKATWTVMVYLAGENNLTTECMFALTVTLYNFISCGRDRGRRRIVLLASLLFLRRRQHVSVNA